MGTSFRVIPVLCHKTSTRLENIDQNKLNSLETSVLSPFVEGPNTYFDLNFLVGGVRYNKVYKWGEVATLPAPVFLMHNTYFINLVKFQSSELARG